jgi:hypothetical protein
VVPPRRIPHICTNRNCAFIPPRGDDRAPEARSDVSMRTRNTGKDAECIEEEPSPGSVQARPPTREEMSLLLQHVAASARPGEGSGRALANVVRVLSRCPWMEGELSIEVVGDGAQSRVHICAEREGTRADALPAVVLAVSAAELERELREASTVRVRSKSGTHRRLRE